MRAVTDIDRSARRRSDARRSTDCSAARWPWSNAEFRIPLFGTEGFGLINFPFLPTEVSPFFDAGVAYTNAQGPDFRFATNGEHDAGERVSNVSRR